MQTDLRIPTARPSPTWQAHLAMLSAAILFGIGFVTTKMVVNQVPPAAWALFRILAAAGLLAGLFGRQVWQARLSRRELGLLGLCSLFGVVLNQVLFAYGLQRTTPAHSVLINGMAPFMTLLLSNRLYGERLTAGKVIGFGLALSGLAYLLEIDRSGWSSSAWIGDLLTVGNALSYAIYLVISRASFRHYGWQIAITVMFLWGIPGIATVGLGPLMAFPWSSLSATIWLLMAFMIVGPTVGGYVANAWALRTADPSHVAAYMYVQPIVAISLASWVLGDRVTTRLLLSCLLIFAGLTLAMVLPAWQARREQAG